MLSNEFKARMIMIDLNQTSMANTLQISTRTVNRWLNETIIPEIAVLALEALEARYKANNQDG